MIFAVVLFTLAGVGVSAAPKVGDKLGDVLYTDIRTFIDGWYIDSYNIGGNTYIGAGFSHDGEQIYGSQGTVFTIGEDLVPVHYDGRGVVLSAKVTVSIIEYTRGTV